MSAGLAAFQAYAERLLEILFEPVTVHLYGLGNEEIHGGGYAAQPYSEQGNTFRFTGEAPRIYGYYLMDDGKKIYSESLPQPWQALNAGDVLEVRVDVGIKVKHG